MKMQVFVESICRKTPHHHTTVYPINPSQGPTQNNLKYRGIESRISWSAAASSDAVNSRTLHWVTWRSQLSVHLYQKCNLLSGSAEGLVLVLHWMAQETHGWYGEHDRYRFNDINSLFTQNTMLTCFIIKVLSEMILTLPQSALIFKFTHGEIQNCNIGYKVTLLKDVLANYSRVKFCFNQDSASWSKSVKSLCPPPYLGHFMVVDTNILKFLWKIIQ